MLIKGNRGIVEIKDKIVIKRKNPKSTAIGRIEIEATFLKRLNKYNIGPKFISFKNDELTMERIKGIGFENYIKTNDWKPIVTELFSQMYQMDKLKINKMEMHHPIKHIIVRENKPVLIDFERCKVTQNPKNVSQFVEYLRKLRLINYTDEMKKLVQEYKKEINKEKTSNSRFKPSKNIN